MSLLVDSSVWIDFFNGVPTPQADLLHGLIGQTEIIVGDLILAEVLQGFRSEADYREALAALLTFDVRRIGGVEVALRSADNYRLLRAAGVQVEKTIDCLIATHCIETDTQLLHSDRDFRPFEIHLGLEVLHPRA